MLYKGQYFINKLNNKYNRQAIIANTKFAIIYENFEDYFDVF